MHNKKYQKNNIEIIIGIAAPLGANKRYFMDQLVGKLKLITENVIPIKITELIPDSNKLKGLSSSLSYFFKMELCSILRKEIAKGFLAKEAVKKIAEKRLNGNSNNLTIFIVDQIKNNHEYEVLSFVYGLNYIQISLFSNEEERVGNLINSFKNEHYTEDKRNEYKTILDSLLLEYNKNNYFKNCIPNDFFKEILPKYEKEILPDSSSRLIKKDFEDIFIQDETSGQQVSKIFHKSHYFFNLDTDKSLLSNEMDKFIDLLMGNYNDCPTQDEFGMCLAYQASVRSNFPGNRQIGACIISDMGEIISVASIRTPSQLTNTSLNDKLKVEYGYNLYKDKIGEWLSFIEDCKKENKQNKIDLEEMKMFIKNTLDFHPCTHAEISAILDAAKLGVSVRNSTLYTTTFPCHICAKDIINAHIKRVVYLEAYPKSKNKELYPEIININPKHQNILIPFEFFTGISPKRYFHVYSEMNKINNKKISKHNSKMLPPLLKYENPDFYREKESAIIKNIEENKFTFLNDLLGS